MANNNSADLNITPSTEEYTFPASSDTLVGRASSDTLTNKAINADNNTITNIGADEVKTNLIVGQPVDASPDGAADYVLTYDASAAGFKRVLLNNLPGGGGISNVVEDTTPQLGGSLDVNGQKIVSVSNGNIDIEPNGTGNVLLGNFTFDADQTVGAGQDNYVLTYDNASGLISLEAAAGGGGGTTYNVNSLYVDQSGGTSDTYGVLSGTINGVNTTFTVSEGSYASGTLKVYLNGQLQTQGTSEDWDETTPGSGTFDFNTAPASGDQITVEYAKTVSAAIPYVKSATVESPTSSEDITLFFTDDAITITQMNAVLRGSSTPSVTWTIRHNSDRSAAGNEVVTSGTTTTSTTTGSEVISFNDATIPAGSWVWLETSAQSGTVDELNITLEYTRD